ncbi:MAG: hypothetical protein LUF32_03555 [Clostridiales bacterium]|nr:hypothetical protein [Clostridiales bacterium]
MTERQIENRVSKLNALEEQITLLQEQADSIKSELKNDLERKGLDEVRTKNFIVRWKEVISNRLDSKALKAALPDVYSQYCRKQKEHEKRQQWYSYEVRRGSAEKRHLLL